MIENRNAPGGWLLYPNRNDLERQQQAGDERESNGEPHSTEHAQCRLSIQFRQEIDRSF
jgi:hypothetical protein